MPAVRIKLNATMSKFCSKCGNEMVDAAVVCPKCGCAAAPEIQPEDPAKSKYDWLVVFLLCFFLGGLGIHRFYVGKTGTGVAQLLTMGGCGIWALIDLIMIAMGNFTDSDDKIIKRV